VVFFTILFFIIKLFPHLVNFFPFEKKSENFSTRASDWDLNLVKKWLNFMNCVKAIILGGFPLKRARKKVDYLSTGSTRPDADLRVSDLEVSWQGRQIFRAKKISVFCLLKFFKNYSSGMDYILCEFSHEKKKGRNNGEFRQLSSVRFNKVFVKKFAGKNWQGPTSCSA
jgi:hypothetical protein